MSPSRFVDWLGEVISTRDRPHHERSRARGCPSSSIAVVVLSSALLCSCADATATRSGDQPSPQLLSSLVVVDSLGRIDYRRNGLKKPDGCEGHEDVPDASEGIVETACHQGEPPAEAVFARFADAFAERPHPNGIMLYFNGGMNTPEDVIAQAGRQRQAIEDDGYFPVFMVWPTAPVGSYFEQIYRTTNGIYSDPLVATGTGRLGTDMLIGAARAPSDWMFNAQRFYRTIVERSCDYLVYDPALLVAKGGAPQSAECIERGMVGTGAMNYQPKSFRVRDGGTSTASKQVIFSDSVNEGPDGWGDAVKLTLTAAPRVALMPFADGLGEQAWKNMKRRSERSVRAEYELAGEGQAWDELRERYPHGLGGFAEFLALLEACSKPKGKATVPPCPPQIGQPARDILSDTPPKITLIGHSMGAIVVNLLVEAFPNLNYRDIAFLSGAATINQTKTALDPLLSRHATEVHFYNLMLHPMSEAREMHYAGAIPTGSLLVWIDDMLEHPDTLLDRTVGQWANMRGGRRHFSAEARCRMQLKIFDWAPRTYPPNVTDHGGFNDDGVPYWRRSFWSSETGVPSADIVHFADELPPPRTPDCPDPGSTSTPAT